MEPGQYDDFLDAVERFQRTVLEQRPVQAGHYDAAYFVADWREGDNRYDIDTRRRIEGQNPVLIKEVFEPVRVLDVGCGPGFVMFFLHELCVYADGVDFSPASKDLAPPAIRERIAIGSVTRLEAANQAYDLVLCREVMEHLTILQVRRAVAEICRVSSRYVYVTTRFHPAPADLLDVATQFDVDPSHITLLAKDLLRVLFVLEGFSRRADLEERLDWARKNRVLVYERQAAASAPA